ncbi:MAG: hypothetical protein HQK83_16615 [Fibrobacteria bacterium]|nr:hypothetical protein [Fibrobacteria bacterium]
MRFGTILFLSFTILYSLSFSAVCDAKYFAQKLELITLTGSDASSLEISSVETLKPAFNDIPVIDTTTINYQIPIEFTSACNAFEEHPIKYLKRGRLETEFSEIDSTVWGKFIPSLGLAGTPAAPWFIIKRDSAQLTNASEYFKYTKLTDSTRTITGVYCAGQRTDTVKNEFGTILGRKNSSLPWDPYIDTTIAMAHIRESFKDQKDPYDVRTFNIQIVMVYYDTAGAITGIHDEKQKSIESISFMQRGASVVITLPQSVSPTAHLKIFSLSGKLMKSISTTNGRFVWDGTSTHRSNVSHGIYFFEAGSMNGKFYYSPDNK